MNHSLHHRRHPFFSWHALSQVSQALLRKSSYWNQPRFCLVQILRWSNNGKKACLQIYSWINYLNSIWLLFTLFILCQFSASCQHLPIASVSRIHGWRLFISFSMTLLVGIWDPQSRIDHYLFVNIHYAPVKKNQLSNQRVEKTSGSASHLLVLSV